ncbi:MAG: PilN domain-containing protein [Candidatus Omnitrophota bacterium]
MKLFKILRPFGPPNDMTIGLDISPKEIRVIAGGKEFSSPTPEGAISDGVIVEKEKIADAVKDLFKSKGITAKDVITAVSGRGILLHLSNIPSMGPESLKDAVKEEASKYMIFAGSDLLSDFFVIEEVREEGLKQLKILSVVAKKEIIDSYLETIKLSDLKLQAIEAGPISLARVAFSQGLLSEGVVIFTAVETDSAEIFVFNEGNIRYLHNVDILDELDSEMESIIGYCKDNFGKDTEIKKVMSSELEDVSVVRGLALRAGQTDKFPVKINLLPLEEIRLKELNRRGLLLAKGLGVLVAVLFLYFFFLRFQTWFMFKKADATRSVLTKASPAFNELLALEEMDRKYSDEINAQEKIINESRGEDWSRILQELKRIIPKNAYLFSINTNQKGMIDFKGEAIDQNTVFDFVQSLKASEFFVDVNLKESKDAEIKSEKGYAFFVIQCGIKR